MSFFWLLCLCLVLVGVFFGREVRAALGDWWLAWFGVRVRAVKPDSRTPGRSGVSPPYDGCNPHLSPHDLMPPPRVVTRPGP